MALVPGTNLTLLARDLMLGQAHLHPAGVLATLCSTVAFGALALSFAARLYDSERLLSSTDGELVSLGAWLRHLFGRSGKSVTGTDAGAAPHPAPPPAHHAPEQGPNAGHAAALFGVAFILWFFVFTWLQRWRLIPGLVISQWGGFLGLVALYARATRQRLRDVMGLRMPNAWALVGATLLGLSGWVLLGLLADRLMPPPRHLIEEMRRLIRPPDGSRPLAVSLAALALTPAICEEALFRGPILRGFRSRFSTAAACVLTGILFGILHGDVWRFLPTALLGTLLSWVALTSGSIVPAMLVHLLNNGALVVLGYQGLDEAAEKLPLRAEIALFAVAAALFGTGLAAVRRGRAPRAP
jgi:sodium transport system permease protein